MRYVSRGATLAAGLAALLATSVLSAQSAPGVRQQQQPAAQQPRSSVTAPGHQRQSANADAQLAACLSIDNQNEVALGQFAEQRAHSDEVRKFAQMMVDDHSRMLTKLQPFADGDRTEARQDRNQQPDARSDTPRRAPVQRNDNPQQQQPPAAQNGQAPPPARMPMLMPSRDLDFLSIKRELGEQCLASARKELGEKSGPEFDHCYVGMQIGAHQHALDAMEVFKRHASPEFQAALDEGMQTVRAHLDHAKSLAKEMMKKHEGANRTTQRESESRNK